MAGKRSSATGCLRQCRRSAVDSGGSFEDVSCESVSRAYQRLHLPFRAIQRERNPWLKIWQNLIRWMRRCRSFSAASNSSQLALNRKKPALALNDLQAVTPIELGQIAFVANISCLYHVYIRGEAYLAAGQGNAAAAEFQKILDHSGIVWNCWTGALAHLGVARANALQSRTSQGADADAARVRALAAYKDFLTLWKDADPDIPILKQAKAEYAKLQ